MTRTPIAAVHKSHSRKDEAYKPATICTWLALDDVVNICRRYTQ